MCPLSHAVTVVPGTIHHSMWWKIDMERGCPSRMAAGPGVSTERPASVWSLSWLFGGSRTSIKRQRSRESESFPFSFFSIRYSTSIPRSQVQTTPPPLLLLLPSALVPGFTHCQAHHLVPPHTRLFALLNESNKRTKANTSLNTQLASLPSLTSRHNVDAIFPFVLSPHAHPLQGA